MDERKVWVPAVPMPFFGFWRKRCIRCNRKFRSYEKYEQHYVMSHIVNEYLPSYECMQELPVSRAIDLGYGLWLMRQQAYTRKRDLILERRLQRRQDRDATV